MPPKSKVVRRLAYAAKAGNTDAQLELAHRFWSGRDVRSNPLKAELLFRMAAEGGNAEAQYELATFFEELPGTSFISENEALEMFHKAADQGHTKAQYELGRCYTGCFFGVCKNDESYEWFKLAAQKGHAQAQYELGLCYEAGSGVARNLIEAVVWFRKAAEQGVEEAQYKLGACYTNGEGVEKDVTAGEKWLRPLAESGHSAAQYELGNCCVNKAEAVEWWSKVAQQTYVLQGGHLNAQIKLYYAYAHGEGVEKDEKKANQWRQLILNNFHNIDKYDPLFHESPGSWRKL